MELISAANGMAPAWSPDGQRIAFLSNRAEGWDLYIMNADGTDVRRLSSGATASDPAWSPDGQTIAVERRQQIEIIQVDGDHRHILIDHAQQPAWAPDARTAFIRDEDLWLRQPDGREQRLLHDADAPAWSPTTDQIAVVHHGGIAIFDPQTRHQRQLTRNPSDNEPAWTPDASAVTFVRNGALWQTPVETPDPRPLTHIPSPAGGPAWQPHGDLLAFHLHRDGNWDICIADHHHHIRSLTRASWTSWNARA